MPDKVDIKKEQDAAKEFATDRLKEKFEQKVVVPDLIKIGTDGKDYGWISKVMNWLWRKIK